MRAKCGGLLPFLTGSFLIGARLNSFLREESGSKLRSLKNRRLPVSYSFFIIPEFALLLAFCFL